ncbi:hypothetical protein [Fodinibius sp. SL11]|uniref:hypothetical protein n=1 Tax=Fodinibius sp. SL11 TaxID=3425690 RepID=UPI003F883DFB
MGAIIHLDDDQDILDRVESYYEQLNIDLELIPCGSIEEFEKLIKDESVQIRSLIFDLVDKEPGKDELNEGDADFLNTIEQSFARFNVPIFIYSGFLESLEDGFEEYGSVFKISKDESSEVIFNRIELFHKSGFLEVFGPGGEIEEKLHKDLHQAFISQFTDNTQIEAIINLIKDASEEENFSERVKRVFKRIAIRSLLTDLKNPILESGVDDEFLNPVEHYVQRISKQEIVTGDIFKNEEDEYVVVLTPRCDLANKEPDSILVCNINTEMFPEKTRSNKQIGKILSAITDNPKYSGYDRYLVRSPFFKGGLVKLTNYRMIPKESLVDSYERIISLSDELTNEILGKFGSYFFRTGITTWDLDETVAFLKQMDKDGQE